MKLPDLLSNVSNDAEFFETLNLLAGTSEHLQSLKTALEQIHTDNAKSGLAFSSSLGASRISIILATSLAEFAAMRARHGEMIANKGLELLPELVSPKVNRENYISPQGVSESVASLFFKYAQHDPAYRSINLAEIPSRLVKFSSAMERLRRFVTKGPFGVPLSALEELVNMRDISYASDWKIMTDDFQKTVEHEKSKTERSPELDERFKNYRKLLAQCKMVTRYEQQENIQITFLYEMRPQLYATLGLLKQ